MEIIGWRCGWLLLGLGFETSNMRVKHARQTPMNNGGCCCLTATMVPHSRRRGIQQSADMLYNRSTLLNSLTAKSVPAGTKNSRSEGFSLAKHKHINISTMMEPFPPVRPTSRYIPNGGKCTLSCVHLTSALTAQDECTENQSYETP